MFRNNKKNTIKEYSKKATTILLTFALIDIQLTYVLAFLGMTEIAETLSVALVTEVLGVFGGYLIRAYLGKRNEENNRITKEIIEAEKENSTDGLE